MHHNAVITASVVCSSLSATEACLPAAPLDNSENKQRMYVEVHRVRNVQTLLKHLKNLKSADMTSQIKYYPSGTATAGSGQRD